MRRRPRLPLVRAALACLAALLAACGGHGEDYGPDGPPPAPQPISNSAPVPSSSSLTCPKGSLLTYENFGEGFMLNYCTSCHASTLTGAARSGAPAGIDLDTPTGVALQLAAILKDTIADKPTMPPGQTVFAADLALAKEWLNCGAPTTTGDAKLN